MKNGLLAGSAATVGVGLLANTTSAQERGRLNPGDAAILRFLAAAELIEVDLWTQYAELGGIGKNPPVEIDPNQSMNNYQIALSNLDSDSPQYIASNTLDEVSHANFSCTSMSIPAGSFAIAARPTRIWAPPFPRQSR
ncbi:MAG: hypothetical protein QOH35_3669 [Acidobacteriaceae bacterium]|nr:hypothetical protein [Acidobacteriaceae bacterium]